MATTTSIEWTEMTWNPVTGCRKVTQGCKHCYADRMANRLKAMGSPRYAAGFEPTLHVDLLDLPRRWRQPRVIFVNSMSDLFQNEVPTSFIQQAFATMVECPQHTFQVLTKRADRLAQLAPVLPWPRNVWMGVSVESARVLSRVDYLLEVPAAVRFLSCEPLIGPLDALSVAGIDWAIVGGESGPKARPMSESWARTIQSKCRATETSFFMKQMGGARGKRGRLEDLPEDLRVREYPTARPRWTAHRPPSMATSDAIDTQEKGGGCPPLTITKPDDASALTQEKGAVARPLFRPWLPC